MLGAGSAFSHATDGGVVATTANAATWRMTEQSFPGTFPIEEQLRFLLRYAILAPSTRNSQPWRFTVDGNAVLVRADPTRWQPVADPGRRELHLSLGCALENLLIAAGCVGYRHTVAYFPEPHDRNLAAVTTFSPGPRPSPSSRPEITLETLQARHTERRPFSAHAVPMETVEHLRAIPGEPGVRLELSDATDRRRQVDVLNVRALGTLFGNTEYRDEVARAVGGGSFGGAWLANQVGRLALQHISIARRLARQESQALLSAPLIGVIGSLVDGPAEQVRSGRLLERLWLTATAHGLALQPLSQALQVPSLRVELAARFPAAGSYPQQFFRLGLPASRSVHATPRRPVEDVLTNGDVVPRERASGQ